MKKRLMVVLVILVFLVGSVGVYGLPKSPPKTGGEEGETASAKGTGGAAQEGFVEIMKGKKVPAMMLGSYFKEDIRKKGYKWYL